MARNTPESDSPALSRPSTHRGNLHPVSDSRGVQEPLSVQLGPPASLQLAAPVFGIDPSTLRVACAAVLPYDEGLAWDTLSLPRLGTDPRRFAAALDVLEPWLTRLLSEWGCPSHVFVEQPFAQGRNVRPSGQHMVGTVLCALGHTLPLGVTVGMCGPSEWKAGAIGRGHGFDKPEQYFAWARSVGYTGQIEDEAAALGVATFAGIRASEPVAA